VNILGLGKNPLQTQGIAETILDDALAQLEVESNMGDLA